MIDFQKKKKLRKIIYSPFVLALLFIIFILLIKGLYNVYSRNNISKLSLEREKKELEKIVSREKNLINSLEYLKTDQGIENEIRVKFRAVKEGEKIAVIIDENATNSTSNPVIQEEKGFFRKLFGL